MAEQIPAPYVPIHKANYGDEVMAHMAQLQKDTVLTDFKILVSGKAIDCHKVVLSATCPYFTALFNSGMRESQQGEVTMDTMDYDIMSIIIMYLYGNNASLNWKHVKCAIETCELLQLQELKEQLAKYVLEHVSVDNCIGWWKFSERYNLTEVGKKSRELMCTQLEKVSLSDEFKALEFAELVDYIKNHNVMMPIQDAILIACIEWVDYDPVSRKDMMLDILKHVQLPHCSSSAINTVTKKYKDLITDPKAMRMIYEAFLPRLEEAEKMGERKLVVLGGMEGYDGGVNPKCWVLSGPVNHKWEEFAEFPSGSQAAQSPVVCLPSGFAVMCGGDTHTKNTMYNAHKKAWGDLPPTPMVLKNPTAILCDNAIYILGGKDNGSGDTTDIVYHMDLNTLKWHEDPKMLEKQCFPIAATMGNHLYVVYNNDENGTKTPAPLQHYTKGIATWQYKQSLPMDAPGTNAASLVCVEKSLYLVGGYIQICACYTMTTDTWTLLTRPSIDNYYRSAVTSKGKIYLCGGGWRTSIADIEEYDITEDKWITSKLKLPIPLNFITAKMVSFL